MMADIASRKRGIAVLGAFLALSILVSLPILAARLPPILDYPNHLARMYLLATLDGADSLGRYYELAWAPLPNLAFDAIVPWLSRAIPVEAAMRLALAATLIATAGGCLALHRILFKRWSAWPLTAFLLLYNRMLLWGFLNYLAGLALTLWALAAWIALERRNWIIRLAVGIILATTIYFAHLAAFGCYALALIAYAAAPSDGECFALRPALSRLILPIATLVPGALLFLSSPTSGANTGIAYGNPLRKFDLPVSIFDNYSRIFDGATFAVVLIAVVVGLARGGIATDRRFRWSVVALIAAFLLLPSRLFTASGLDHRLPIAIAFLFVAAADWCRLSRRWRVPIAASLLVLFLVRLTIVGLHWTAADGVYAELAPAFAALPRASVVAVAAPAADVRAGGVPLLHFPALAVPLRDAFVPTLFADPAQQPIRPTAEGAHLVAEAEPAALWQAIAGGATPPLPGYDVLMIVKPPPSLDARNLPGERVFASPLLIVIRLPKSVQ